MILESLLQDNSKWTIDCCKATMRKGDVIEIPDQFYNNAEVQGGLKLGYAKVVGALPQLPPVANIETERKVRMKSEARGILAFDCIKASVEQGGIIQIPMSKLNDVEIRSAIDSGLLVNPDVPKSEPLPRGQAVTVEEVAIVDPALPTGVPQRRPRRANNAPPALRAKRVSSGDEVEESTDGLYAESRVIEPGNENVLKTKNAPKPPKPEAPTEVIADDKFSFLEIFGNK